MSGFLKVRSTISALAFVGILASSMMVSVSQNDDKVVCAPVAQDLSPCLDFIKGKEFEFAEDKPSAACCNGVKKVAADAKTKEDKVAMCGCIKKILGMIGSYDSSRIPLIPKACGIPIELPPVDKSTDCSKVQGFQFGSGMVFGLGNNYHY